MDRDPLTLQAVYRCLVSSCDAALRRQCTDPAQPCRGGVVDPDSGLDDASHGGTAPLLAGLLAAGLAASNLGCDQPLRQGWPARAALAAEYLVRVQRPTGRTDLRSCNYDSAPDAAFAVEALAPLLMRAREGGLPGEWDQAVGAALTFVRRAADGLVGGGFHTPNHRWVVASALALADRLLADFDAREELHAYLAEGLDIDADGAWQERSVESYDAVCDRAVLLVDRFAGWPGALEAAAANLRLAACLLDADGVAETALSRRWGGLDVVPLALATPALMVWARTGSDEAAELARRLWAFRNRDDLSSLSWLAWALLDGGQPPARAPAPQEDGARLFIDNGLYRARRGRGAISLFAHRRDLLHVRCGRARIVRTFIRQSYFGAAGDFVADSIEAINGGVRLICEGLHHPRRPGYELPLGRPVPGEQWEAMLDQRAQRRLPPARVQLDAAVVEGGLDLHLRSLDGLDGVTAMVAFDVPPGARWDSDSTALETAAGQVIALKGGTGRVRYGDDWICVGPGGDAHTILHMRDAAGLDGFTRIVIPMMTPLDHRLQIRWG